MIERKTNERNEIKFACVEELVPRERFPETKTAVMDSAYRTPWICKKVFEDERRASLPYKCPMTKDGFFRKYEYVYDEHYDCVLCPNNQILKYSTTNREGYREYKSNPKVCVDCPCRAKCTESKAHQKIVTRHVWEVSRGATL
jgi:hypothetical protein